MLDDIRDYISGLKSDMNKSEFGRYHPGNISMDTNMAGNTIHSQKYTASNLLSAYSFIYGPHLVGKGSNYLFRIKTRAGVLEEVQGLWLLDLLDYFSNNNESRGGRDAKPGTTVPPVGPGRRPRPPVKPSRPGKPGQTSKPFWSKGKPKCKKGFRYDFKRKLCVKIK